MYQSILTEVDAGVGIITLNRPERHNAFDEIMVSELSAALAAMQADATVRVLVISSTGKTFCAGADLDWMKRTGAATNEENLRDAGALAEMLRDLAYIDKPTVARVQGSAYGGGLGLVAACDVAIATFDSQFALSQVRLGIIPAVIGPYMIKAIGPRHARRYMLTGEHFAAAEAYRIGLLHEIVPDAHALDSAIGEIVTALLQSGTRALAACKELIDILADKQVDDAVLYDTAQRSADTHAGDEAKEGIAAFLEKRTPAWSII
jgi:methylglutaconyl-CoA hydratase